MTDVQDRLSAVYSPGATIPTLIATFYFTFIACGLPRLLQGI